MTSAPRILCVDDEPNVLSGLMRQLSWHYDVVTAISGTDALALIEAQGPFAAVISDMRMPGMDGATFLTAAREMSPDTTRLLLTGYADIDAAIKAVNDAGLFRFLTKPCPTPTLLGAVEAAVRQHELVTSERVLLQKTLRGAVAALTEALSMANPEIFGRATRVQRRIGEVLDALDTPEGERWAIDVAAVLAHLPVLTLPPETLSRWSAGQRLSADEEEMVRRLPATAERLIRGIPRLDQVADIVRYQRKGYDGSGQPADHVAGDDLPLGARLLKLVGDLDALEGRGHSTSEAIQLLRGRTGVYDPSLFEHLGHLLDDPSSAAPHILELTVAQLRSGMVIVEDVRSRTGVVVLSRGHEVNARVLDRLQNFDRGVGIHTPIRVVRQTRGDGV